MADIDFYGYERAEPGKFLYSSDYAAVYFANTPGGSAVSAAKAGLVQSAAVSYQHNVQPRFEAGSSELFFISGQSMGTLQLARLIGDRGILDGINHGANRNDLRKGVLGGVEFKVGKLNMQGVAVKQEVLVLSGCVLQGFGLSFNVGGLEVQEALTIQTALVKRGFRA